MGKTYPTRIEDAARKRFGPGLASECYVEGCDRPGMAFDTEQDFETICLVHICERAGIPLSPVDAFPDETTVTCANCGTSGVRDFYRMNGEWFCLPNCRSRP